MQLADQGSEGEAVDVEDLLHQAKLQDLVGGAGAFRPRLNAALVGRRGVRPASEVKTEEESPMHYRP